MHIYMYESYCNMELFSSLTYRRNRVEVEWRDKKEKGSRSKKTKRVIFVLLLNSNRWGRRYMLVRGMIAHDIFVSIILH